jgi:arsenite methyltransferase
MDRSLRVVRTTGRGRDDPHLPTTLKRRLQATGFDVETIDVVPVLNADFDPHTYSARHIEIISDYVARHGISCDEAAAWANLFECAELGEYFFSLSRYVFTGRKP